MGGGGVGSGVHSVYNWLDTLHYVDTPMYNVHLLAKVLDKTMFYNQK